jgi:poly-gamma-glutamate capsule biosynthesis protein CapA/YwtB (metallophosphatase superfamily)
MKKILLLNILLFFTPARAYQVIENFESGTVNLYSYPGEDLNPHAWRLDSTNAFNSRYSLMLYGNTWKIESILPQPIDTNSMWQVACYVSEIGEIQGIGFTDSRHTLFYAFFGSEMLNIQEWITVCQGAFSVNTWHCYLLPVGEDWLNYFGYLPTIRAVIYINDCDEDPSSIVYFDELYDITEDLPIAPRVEIWYQQSPLYFDKKDNRLVDVQFYSRVIDPDSKNHQYFWFFGDDSVSNDSCPFHSYEITDNHEYTVLLRVKDNTNLWGAAITRIRVDSGPSTLPLTINFVGDIMLGRRYEAPGGIINTLGVESIFSPTKRYLGDDADITVANLESPFTNQNTPHPTKPIIFRSRPENVRGLVYAGVDLVSLANNHIFDYLEPGLNQTRAVLDSARILHCGAGSNLYEALLANFINKKGINVGFLAFSDRTGQYNNYQPYLNAGYNKAGFALLDTFYVRQALNRISKITDLKIVLLHSGREYSLTPTPQDQEDEFYSEAVLVPCSSDIRVRHFIIENGAQLVINHHPHIIQGFEVYGGKLIAHSLGNFCFDLNYPETYPSVILKGYINKDGFYRYIVTPVYIDSYIPRRAWGELGLQILRYLAFRSREFNTYLIVNQDSVNAEILLDTTLLTFIPVSYVETASLSFQNGYYQSAPIKLNLQGSISSITHVIPNNHWEARLGSELKWFWFGNCENEGANMWLMNDTNEMYDTIAYRGQRSIIHRQRTGGPLLITNLKNYIPCYSDTKKYTLYSYIKTQNVSWATVQALSYLSRSSTIPLGIISLDTVNHTASWNFYYQEFIPPQGTKFFDVRLVSAPSSGTSGYAWYDDIGIIEWTPWQPIENLTTIPNPNDYTWLQLRTSSPLNNAQLEYTKNHYLLSSPVLEYSSKKRPVLDFRIYPNPALSLINIRFMVNEPQRVNLKIYDILGRKIRTIFKGNIVKRDNEFIWDGRDNYSKKVRPGVYFCVLETQDFSKAYKIILLPSP